MWNWTTEDEILPYKKISWDKFEWGKPIWIKTLEITRKAFTEKTWLTTWNLWKISLFNLAKCNTDIL